MEYFLDLLMYFLATGSSITGRQVFSAGVMLCFHWLVVNHTNCLLLFHFFGMSPFSHSVMSYSLRPHGLQHARLPCPSPTSRAYSNSCTSRWWCHSIISSIVVPFSSRLQSFPTLGSFQMSQLFTSGGQSIGISASTSVLPMNIQDWFPLGWTDWISLQSKGLSRVFSNTTVQKHQFFGAQLSLYFNSHIHIWLLEKTELWLDGTLLAK